MNTTTILKKTYLLGLLLAFHLFSGAQTCDTTLVNARVNAAGFTRLYVPGQPCSLYFVSDTNVFGINARQMAASLGIPQLVINDLAENSQLLSALFTQGIFPSNPEVWLGITDSATPYTWRTFDGSALPAYTNWAAGEPNNSPPTCQVGPLCLCTGRPHDIYWCSYGEDCVVMDGAGEWIDNTCEGDGVARITVLELNTCPVLTKPTDMTICAGTSVTVSAIDSSGALPVTYTWNPGSLTGYTVTITPAATDTILVHSSDVFHCIIDSSFIITVIPKTSIPPIITPINRDTLTTTAYAAYQWLMNGAALTGDTTASYVATANGPYQVVVIDSNGCSDTSVVYNVTGVGIRDITAHGNILIYPNPNNGSFMLESNNSIGREFVIYDMIGRTVARQTITSDKQSIKMKSMSPGTYTLEIKGSTSSSIKFTIDN